MKPSPSRPTPPAPAKSYRIMHALMWPLMKVLGLSCRQFAMLTSLRLDRPLSFTGRLRFGIHSLLCGVCRPLPGQLENMRQLLRFTAGDEKPPDNCSELSSGSLARLRSRLEEEGRR